MHDDFFLPGDYLFLPDDEAGRRIEAHRRRRASELQILAHTYMRASLTEHADVVGDGSSLARAVLQSGAAHLVCCGASYVADNALLLRPRPRMQVHSPVRDAVCPMAEAFDAAQLELGLQVLQAEHPQREIVPVVSVTSSVAAKAVAGRRGGLACGTENAHRIVARLLERGALVLFGPDRPLGQAVARRLGLEPGAVAAWALGQDPPPRSHAVRLLLVSQACPVHAALTLHDLETTREAEPGGVRILLQADLPFELTAEADFVGSIGELEHALAASPPGMAIAIGSEIHHVEALARRFPDRRIRSLGSTLCGSMYTLSPQALLWLLDHLDDEPPLAEVPEEDAAPARLALERMLAYDP